MLLVRVSDFENKTLVDSLIQMYQYICKSDQIIHLYVSIYLKYY